MTMPQALVAVSVIAAVTVIIVSGHGEGLFVGAFVMVMALIAFGS